MKTASASIVLAVFCFKKIKIMYKIIVGNLISVDRILNDLVITSLQSGSNFNTLVRVDIIFQSCNGNNIVTSLGTDLVPFNIDHSYTLNFFGGAYSNGIYIFKLYHINNNTSYATEITILNYGKVLGQIIREYKLNVCKKCGCEECLCNEEGSKCIKLTSIHNKLQRYVYSNTPFYIEPSESFTFELLQFLQRAYKLYTCELNNIACCSGTNTKITGEIGYNEKETKFHISILYIGIYFYHKYSISPLDEDQLKNLDIYFNIPSIKKCLQEYVDFSDLEEIYVGGGSGEDYLNNVTTIGSNPIFGEQGVLTTVTVSTNIVSNDDVITSAILRANGSTIYNLLSTVDNGVQNLPITGVSISTDYDIVITFTRNGIPMTETKTTEYDAYVPQWYGTSINTDYEGETYATINGELDKVVQGTATIEEPMNPSSQYIHFISTKANALISNSGFNVSIGTWGSTTSAFIKKSIDVSLANGSIVTMTFYRSRVLMTHSPQIYKIY